MKDNNFAVTLNNILLPPPEAEEEGDEEGEGRLYQDQSPEDRRTGLKSELS